MEVDPLVYSDEEMDVRASKAEDQKIDAWRDLLVKSTKIGEGGFGAVYRTKRESVEKLLDPDKSPLPTLDDFVAVKVMTREQENWSKVLRTAQRETRMLMNVQQGCNSHNLQCYFADQIVTYQGEEIAYIVITKFIEGMTLFSYIRDTPNVRASTLAYILRKLALAIDYLHSSFFPSIVHGDIKTKNIMIDENDEPWIIDFGFACLGQNCTESYSRRGTPQYMSHKKLLNYVWHAWENAEDDDKPKWVDVKKVFKKNMIVKKSDFVVKIQDTKDADRWAFAVVAEYLLSSRNKSNLLRGQLSLMTNLALFLNKGYAAMFPSGIYVSLRHETYIDMYDKFAVDCCLDVLKYPRAPDSWPTLKTIAAAAAQYEIAFKKIEADLPVFTYHARINTATNARFLLASIGSAAAPPCIWDRTTGRPHCKCTFASVDDAARLFSAPRYLAGAAVCPVCGDNDC